MKRLIIIAALAIVAAIGAKAQTPAMPTDSVSVMFQHLANTNAEVAYLNDNLRLHSQLALGSFALEGIGAACLMLSSSSAISQGFADMEPLAKLGIGLCAIGGIGFICSYIPIWTSKVNVDERGIIVHPSELLKK